jgi:hypothetical protein
MHFQRVDKTLLIKLMPLEILIFISVVTFGQKGFTFQVEELPKPERLLYEQEYKQIYKNLILSDAGMRPLELKKNNFDFPFNMLAQGEAPDSLVSFGYHSFFNGMYQAYADHRPFVLSPDMIWLLISQGFARHIHANAEALRNRFVNFEGKVSLIVRSDSLELDSPADWEMIFPEFTRQIAAHTGEDLVNLLSCEFSTTGPAEKVASEITVMEAMEPYFEFVVIKVVCGIPEITLKGTPDDWKKILEKTKKLGDYDLRWWTDKLEPILNEFVKASKKNIDNDFWRNMFKYHSQKKYGAPKIIDGWIVKFFPYDKDGKRNNLQQLEGSDKLPEEIVKVDLNYIEAGGDSSTTTPMELWAGFVGLEQDHTDFTLTPKIGWMVRKKDVEKLGIKQKFAADNQQGGISIRVREIPKEIYEFGEIENLQISFIDEIIIPDELEKVKIGRLRLSGKINETETQRIRKMFPNTQLIINGKNSMQIIGY